MNKKNKLLSIVCLSMTLGGFPFQAAAKEGTVSKTDSLLNRTLQKYADNPVLFTERYGTAEVNLDNWSDILQAYELYLDGDAAFCASVDELLTQRRLPPIQEMAIRSIRLLNTLDEKTRTQWKPIVEKLRQKDAALPEVQLPEAVTIISEESSKDEDSSHKEDSSHQEEETDSTPGSSANDPEDEARQEESSESQEASDADNKEQPEESSADQPQETDADTDKSSGSAEQPSAPSDTEEPQETDESTDAPAEQPEESADSSAGKTDADEADQDSEEEESAVTIVDEDAVIVLPEAEDPEHSEFETNVHPSQIGNDNVDPADQPILDLEPIEEAETTPAPAPDMDTMTNDWNAVIQEVVSGPTTIPNGGLVDTGTSNSYTAPVITITNTYADAKPTVFDTSTLDNITESPSVYSTSYNFNVLHGVNRTISIPNLGSFNLLPDFTNDAAWKNSVSGYNTPGLWGQCTWFAWGRFYELYGFDPGFTGNGYQCVSQLLAAHPDKFSLSKNPASGAVFSSDIFHNHVGIVLEYDESTNLLTIQEGNLDIVSNPVWEEAIADYRTIQVTPATMRSMYGNVTYAVPKEGVKMKESARAVLTLREITLNRLKKQFAAQEDADREDDESSVTVIED